MNKISNQKDTQKSLEMKKELEKEVEKYEDQIGDIEEIKLDTRIIIQQHRQYLEYEEQRYQTIV